MCSWPSAIAEDYKASAERAAAVTTIHLYSAIQPHTPCSDYAKDALAMCTWVQNMLPVVWQHCPQLPHYVAVSLHPLLHCVLVCIAPT